MNAMSRRKSKSFCSFFVCLFIFVLSMLLIMIECIMFGKAKKVDILDETAYRGVLVSKFQTIEVTAGSEEWAERNEARVEFINGGYNQLSSAQQVDARTFACAYSPSLEPCYVPNHGACEYGTTSEIMPTSFFVGTVTCHDVETTQKGANMPHEKYTHVAACTFEEILYLYSEVGEIETVYVHMKNIKNSESLMEIGKTYLIWGLLAIDTDGNGSVIVLSDGWSIPNELPMREENGKHWFSEESDKLIVKISELNVPLAEFWETEIGQIWQKDILPKGEVLYHSTRLVGTDCWESLLSVNRGTAYLVEGKTLTEANDVYGCMISEELAEKNALTVGDELLLKTYRCSFGKYEDILDSYYPDTFDLYEGFVEQHTYRIVGIYRTEDDIHDPHAVHPNTIYVLNESLVGDYWRHDERGSSPTISESNILVDAKYSVVFPADGVDLLKSEMKKLWMNQDYFIIHDGGYAEAREELGELDDAMEAVQAGGARRMWSVGCCALVILAAMVALVWSAKGAVGRRFSVDTPDRKLFGYLYLRQCLPVTVAVALSSAVIGLWYDRLAVWWMSGWTDAVIAEELLAYLPQEPGVPVVAAVVLAVCFLFALLPAWAGVRRKYHYEYSDENEVI